MQVRIKGDTVSVEGYVNAIERKSKPLRSRMGQFVERICKGAFSKAIERNDDVRLLLNHDWERNLGGTKDGTLTLKEDAIGLHARATITDTDVADKARNGDLVGWSFGFTDRDVSSYEENGMPTRDVKDLDLHEVSLLDNTRTPAYEGTLVAVRSDDGEQLNCGAVMTQEIEIREEPTEDTPDTPHVMRNDEPIDYTQYEKLLDELKED